MTDTLRPIRLGTVRVDDQYRDFEPCIIYQHKPSGPKENEGFFFKEQVAIMGQLSKAELGKAWSITQNPIGARLVLNHIWSGLICKPDQELPSCNLQEEACTPLCLG